jgi:hypothetical protein
MGDSTMRRDSAGSAAPPSDPSLPVVLDALAALASSTEPTVVFSDLVQLCVPTVCDAATATITGPDEKVYAVSWPRDAANHDDARPSVVTHFAAPTAGDQAGYHGMMALWLGPGSPSARFLGQLLVERAIATVERARLLDVATRARAEAEHLELALASNREISVAVGILMANERLTSEQAFDLLRRVSMDTNRKLRVVALEVARTGALGVLTPVGTISRPSS